MNSRIEKKVLIILSVGMLLAVLVYAGGHFLYLSPLKHSLALKENQLKSEQKLSESLEARLAVASSANFISTAEIQKRLPVDPMADQLILDLEKAEVVSDSYILSMEFHSSSESDDEQVQVGNKAGQGKSSSPNTKPVNSIRPALAGNSEEQPKPEGLSISSVTVKVEAESYFELEKFIETMENLKRIAMIDSISFKGPEEVSSLSGVNKGKIEMTLIVDTFYMDELDDLKEYDPKIQTPEPGNKRDPFPTYGSFSEDNLVEGEGEKKDGLGFTEKNDESIP